MPLDLRDSTLNLTVVNDNARYPGWGTSSTARGTSLVVFTFRVARREELPGPVLLELLSSLDVSPGAARAVLLRMRRAGWLDVARHGRQATYRLSPLLSSSAQRLVEILGAAPPWDGTFFGLLYSVPEGERAFRDALRRAAMLAGYGMLRPGLLISPVDRSEDLRWSLDRERGTAQVLSLRLSLSTEDARDVAAEVWSLTSLAAAYRRRATVLRRQLTAVRRRPPAASQVLRRYAGALLPVFEVASRDPGLPGELLGDDWPGREVGRLVAETFATMGPMVTDYVSQLLSRP